MLNLVVVGGSQVGAHAAVVAGDDNTAATGGLLLIVAVLNAEADLLDRLLQGLGVLVLADAANVNGGVGREDVLRGVSGKVSEVQELTHLSTSRRVLGGAASDELSVVVLEQVIVQAQVLLLGEDGVVGLQAVLLEELLIAAQN